MRVFRSSIPVFLLVLGMCTLLAAPPPTWAQQTERSPSDTAPTAQPADAPSTAQPLVLTLRDAVQTALEKNLDLRNAQLDLEDADAQVQEAWGNLYPSLNLNGGYTRNVVTANPFAGSDAANLIGGGGQTEWLAFNERRRLSNDQPITFPQFQQRQRDSLAAAGISMDGGGNPFGVDNEFQGRLQLRQTIYSKQAFASVKGSQQFKDVRRYARDREVQQVTNDVVTAFYQALLAKERTRVLQKRVERAEETLQEVSTRVERGTVPKAQRLGADVERSNARPQLIEARNAADLARDNLKQTIGLSPERPVELDGDLEEQRDGGLQQVSLETISMSNAVRQAIENRPDLKRARLNVELREIRKESSRSAFFPTVEAVANFSYSGRVPDDRSRVQTTDPQDPTNPFFFREQDRGFFNDSFWNPSFSVGLQLNWDLFSGFQRSSRVEQAEIQRRRAEIQRDQLRKAVTVEVRKALRDLEDARERIESQKANVRRAELNYDHVSERVEEGVASPLELREASDQLDQSRLNYLQAVHDYLVAQTDLETALGQPLTPTSESYLMSRR
ncbi:MAG: TolC family protein [Bacteroidetes bacterium QS_1_63_11]|nr:MAG: TolC family protein [Bacteroidetes bacterium QS_1_63_11]